VICGASLVGLSDWPPSLETSTASDTITQAKSKRKLCIQTHQKTKHIIKKKTQENTQNAQFSALSTKKKKKKAKTRSFQVVHHHHNHYYLLFISFYYLFLSIFLYR
jgi:Fe2+ transport system protein B